LEGCPAVDDKGEIKDEGLCTKIKAMCVVALNSRILVGIIAASTLVVLLLQAS